MGANVVKRSFGNMASMQIDASHVLENNSNCVIQGCSSSGKTRLCANLLLHADKLFSTPPTLILFCYKTWQGIYDELMARLPTIQFLPRLPTDEELKSLTSPHQHSVLVADDMLREIACSPFFSELFTRMSHHYRITSILLLQNTASQGKFGSTLSKNCHYTFLMRSPRDQYSVRSLGLQMGDYRNLQEAYKDATREPFSYLLISTHPKTPDTLRYRTHVLPSEGVTVCYISQGK